MKAADQKIVIVTRRTRMQELVERFNTRSQAKFYVARAREIAAAQIADFASAPAGGRAAPSTPSAGSARPAPEAEAEFAEYQAEDEVYRAAVDRLREELNFGINVQVIERSFLPNFVFGPHDIVVTIGQDGLVANTAKYALQQPIIAINPDPRRFDGILLPFHVDGARAAVRRTLDGRAGFRKVTLAEAQLTDGQRLLAFNDFFIGNRTHVSARYRLQVGRTSETQSSSGVLVSTGAGSTGWLSSVFNMTHGVSELLGGGRAAAALRDNQPIRLPWEDRRLVYVVREPFVSRHSRADIVAGMLAPGEELILESMMPTEGVIFSDGVEADYLQFNSGAIAQVRTAATQAKLVTA